MHPERLEAIEVNRGMTNLFDRAEGGSSVRKGLWVVPAIAALAI